MTPIFLAALLAIAPTPTPDARPTIPVMSAYLPMTTRGIVWRAPTKTATASPTATATATRQASSRPADWRSLERALMTPGALVRPAPGIYRPSRVLHMAPGVTLEAEGAVLAGRGLYLHKAHGAVVRGLTVEEPSGDGIQVTHSRDVLIDYANVSGAGDGCIDIVEGPEDGRPAAVTVRDSLLHHCYKAMLIGDPGEGQDANLVVRLERVRFVDDHNRLPKVHRAQVTIIDGLVVNWSGARLDVQMGGHVTMTGTRWVAGPDSRPEFALSTGGTVSSSGGSYQEWMGGR